MRKFSEVLSEYLDQRDKLNSDYYENRAVTERSEARTHLDELAKELDVYFENSGGAA